MQIEQVDVIGIEPLQASLNRSQHAFAVIAAGIGIVRLHRQGVFGGDHQPIAAPGGEFPHETFGAALGIAVGGIDKVAAAFDINVKQTAGFGQFGAPAPVGTEGHGAQRQR